MALCPHYSVFFAEPLGRGDPRKDSSVWRTGPSAGWWMRSGHCQLVIETESEAMKRVLVRTECWGEREKWRAVTSRLMSTSSLLTGATMKKCLCRTARPSGPSTRRDLRATELAGRREPVPLHDCPGFPHLPIQARLMSRGFLVFICLHIFERKAKTEDKLKCWAKFIVRVIWEERR